MYHHTRTEYNLFSGNINITLDKHILFFQMGTYRYDPSIYTIFVHDIHIINLNIDLESSYLYYMQQQNENGII